MDSADGRGMGINSFALVSYLSGPLASFLDEIRHDFDSGSRAKAHVTLLPPRPMAPEDVADAAPAWNELRESLQDLQSFAVELGDVEVFPGTQVIYLSVRSGQEELKRIHDALNNGRVAFQEPFPYHPHVTIAQDLSPDDVEAAAQFARWRWSEYPHPRGFVVEPLTFVQNTLENCWADLAPL